MNLAPRSYTIAGIAVAMGVTGQWYPPLWGGAWLLVALPAIALLFWDAMAVRRAPLKMERTARQSLRLGRRETGELILKNTGPRHLTITFQIREPTAFAALNGVQELQVGPYSTRVSEFGVQARELGSHEWPPVYARVLGPLRLAWWRCNADAPLTTEVAPDTLAGTTVSTGIGTAGAHATPVAGAGVEFQGHREYVPGDPLRSVDWKATARRGKPVVKRFGEEQRLELLIAVDVGRRSGLAAGALTRFGHYINVACQLAERSIAQGDRVATVAYSDGIVAELGLGHGARHLSQVRSLLGNTRSVARESNPLVAALTVRRLLGPRGLVVFLSDLDEGEAAGQLGQATRVLAAKHLPLIGSLSDPERATMQQESPQRWLTPYRRLAAQELEREERLTVRQLRRRGAKVVNDHPDRLAASLLVTYDHLRRRRAV